MMFWAPFGVCAVVFVFGILGAASYASHDMLEEKTYEVFLNVACLGAVGMLVISVLIALLTSLEATA